MGLPAFAAVKLIVPAFYSTQDTRTPVRMAVVTMGVNIVLNFIFLFYFFAKFKNGGPALASALAAYFNVSILFVIFGCGSGGWGPGTFWRRWRRLRSARASMGWSAGARCDIRNSTRSTFLAASGVFVGFDLLGDVHLSGLAWLLRCDEVSEVYGIAFHRERRSRQDRVTG